MIPFRKTLAFRILGISFILLALPLFVDSFVVIQRSYRDAVSDARQQLARIAHERTVPFSLLQPVKRAFLVVLEHFLNLNQNFPTATSPGVSEKLKKIATNTDISAIFLSKIGPDGKIVVTDASDPVFLGRDLTNFFQSINLYSPQVYEKGYVNVISYDQRSGNPYYIVSRIVYSTKDDLPLGIISVAADVTKNLRHLLRPDHDEYPIQFALLESDKIVYAATDPSMLFQYFAPIAPRKRKLLLEVEPLAREFLAKKAIPVDEAMGYPFFEFEWNGEPQIGYISVIEGSDLFLLTYASKNAILAAPLHRFFDVYGMYALILVLGTLLAYLLARWLGRPFRHLCQVMDQINSGDLSSRYRLDRVGYEINTLGMAFNGMVDRLLEKKQLAEKQRVQREIYEQELRIGQKVQRSLLPLEMPRYHGVELAELFIPAKEVGGDFFDVYVAEKSDELVLTIADASGKGIFACFYSLDVRGIFRAFARKYHNVGELMGRANRLFCEDTADTGMFVTAAMAFYSKETRLLRYYSCGHNPPLVRRSDGRIERLNHLGVALGLDPDFPIGDEMSIGLEAGDLVILYTDGVTEAQDAHHQLFSEQRLEELLRKEGGLPPGQFMSKLVEEIQLFVGGAPQHDDITVLAMRVTS